MGTDGQMTSVAPGTFKNTFTLADIGVPDVIELHGVDAYHSVYFSVPQTQVVRTATMHIRVHFSPGLIPALSHLKVMLNGSLFATIPVVTNVNMTGTYTAGGSPTDQGTILAPQNQPIVVTANGNAAEQDYTLDMPADMLVRDNQITFEFIGHYTLNCEDPSHSTLWARVDSTTTIELAGNLLPLQDDLKLLPLPFYDSAVNLHPSVPIVFMSQPSPKAMQAAGILASWFGILTDYRPVRFPVSFGTIPTRECDIDRGEYGGPADITESCGELGRDHRDAHESVLTRTAKVLVVSGDKGDDLVSPRVGALALQESFLGRRSISELDLPRCGGRTTRLAGFSTDKITPMWDLAHGRVFAGRRLRSHRHLHARPPDMYYGARPT